MLSVLFANVCLSIAISNHSHYLCCTFENKIKVTILLISWLLVKCSVCAGDNNCNSLLWPLSLYFCDLGHIHVAASNRLTVWGIWLCLFPMLIGQLCLIVFLEGSILQELLVNDQIMPQLLMWPQGGQGHFEKFCLVFVKPRVTCKVRDY